MVTKQQKIERQRKAKEKLDAKKFEELAYYNSRIIGERINRVTVLRGDERLVAGGQTLAVMFDINEILYSSQLELKALLNLQVRHGL